MNAPNFTSVLDKPSAEIERPRPLPIGSYVVAVQGLPRIDKSSKKQTEFSEFTCKVLEALDDVDQEELQGIGGITDKTIKITFYHTEGSIFRLKDFLFDDLGLEDDGGPLRDKLEQTAGRQCIVKIKHVPSDDGKSVYANVAGTAPVAD